MLHVHANLVARYQEIFHKNATEDFDAKLMKYIFFSYDTNGDGVIDLSEVKSLLYDYSMYNPPYA